MSSNNILITITGPSLTGKSKLAELLKPYDFESIVTTTTRPPRKGEIDGVHYHFVSVEKFKSMIEEDLFLENAQVGKNFYGVSKPAFEFVLNKGKKCMAVVEPEGARQIAKYCDKHNIQLYQIFVDNPTQILVERFLKRYKNDDLALDTVYATRIIDMLQKEPKNWIEPAYNGVDSYDQVFELFTPENEQEVTHQVLDAINKKLAKKKEKKNKP